jgi:hypothetical protein
LIRENLREKFICPITIYSPQMPLIETHADYADFLSIPSAFICVAI